MQGRCSRALDAADPDHEACAALLTNASEDLVVPALVLAELDYWCARRLDAGAWLIFLHDVLRERTGSNLRALST